MWNAFKAGFMEGWRKQWTWKGMADTIWDVGTLLLILWLFGLLNLTGHLCS